MHLLLGRSNAGKPKPVGALLLSKPGRQSITEEGAMHLLLDRQMQANQNSSGALLLSQPGCQSTTKAGAMHLLLERKCRQIQVQGTSKVPRTHNSVRYPKYVAPPAKLSRRTFTA